MSTRGGNPGEPCTEAVDAADGRVATPAVSLPTSGGAIRGIGEKVSVNLSTGTASMTVPIAVSPGRSGFAPELSLSYDSGAGNGPFGFGTTGIERCREELAEVSRGRSRSTIGLKART